MADRKITNGILVDADNRFLSWLNASKYVIDQSHNYLVILQQEYSIIFHGFKSIEKLKEWCLAYPYNKEKRIIILCIFDIDNSKELHFRNIIDSIPVKIDEKEIVYKEIIVHWKECAFPGVLHKNEMRIIKSDNPKFSKNDIMEQINVIRLSSQGYKVTILPLE